MKIDVSMEIKTDRYKELIDRAKNGIEAGLMDGAGMIINFSRAAMKASIPAGRTYHNLYVADEFGRVHHFPTHKASAAGQPPAILTGWLYRSGFWRKSGDMRVVLGFAAPHAAKVESMGRLILTPYLKNRTILATLIGKVRDRILSAWR